MKVTQLTILQPDAELFTKTTRPTNPIRLPVLVAEQQIATSSFKF